MNVRAKNFIAGMGSILELFPNRKMQNLTITIPSITDEEAIRNDWEMVGRDLQLAAKIVTKNRKPYEK